GCNWQGASRRKCSRRRASAWGASPRGCGVHRVRRAGRSRQRCGVRGLTETEIAEVRARAVAAAQAQGLPAKVTERTILLRVAALVRPGLTAPDEADAG